MYELFILKFMDAYKVHFMSIEKTFSSHKILIDYFKYVALLDTLLQEAIYFCIFTMFCSVYNLFVFQLFLSMKIIYLNIFFI